jgi:hypothetical protein
MSFRLTVPASAFGLGDAGDEVAADRGEAVLLARSGQGMGQKTDVLVAHGVPNGQRGAHSRPARLAPLLLHRSGTRPGQRRVFHTWLPPERAAWRLLCRRPHQRPGHALRR